MPQTQVNVIVCTDPRRCRHLEIDGRTAEELLGDLLEAVDQSGLEERVQVTSCNCIFGCTYGPRIDVARRWSGDKVLYGSIEGAASITRRGLVNFHRIPENLHRIIQDNLPNGGNQSPLGR